MVFIQDGADEKLIMVNNVVLLSISHLRLKYVDTSADSNW